MLNPVRQPMADPQFFLRPDVFVAYGEDAAAFLKLETDKYEGMDTTQTSALSLVVHGWPASYDTSEISLQDAIRFAEHMIEQGYLTRDGSIGKIASQITYDYPEDAIVYRHEREVPVIRWHHRLRFVSSLISGYVWWKCMPIDKIVQHAQRPIPKRAKMADYNDEEKLRSLVRVFYWLRPWFYEKYRTDPEKQAGLCLFDSLVMLKFLEKYGFYPNLIFGVQMRPFAAHSWVQKRKLILNGSPEVVSPYECILAAARKEG